VARFIFAEDRFPRSIAYCVHAAYERLCHIRPPGDPSLPGRVALERLRVLDAWVRGLSDEQVTAGLHAVLTHLVDETAAICGSIGSELLGYDAPPAEAPATAAADA
jgi:uncharacterized alpha-E superfamily protein